MKTAVWLVFLAILSLVVIGRGIVWADDAGTTPPPPETEKEGGDDGEAEPPETGSETPKQDPQRITTLAQTYGVPEASVTAMRTSGMGWGEMETALELAKAIAGASGSVDTSLQELLAARQAGAGWGELAQRYGFKLGELKGKGHARKDGGEDIGTGGESDTSARDLDRDRARGRDRDRDRVSRPDRGGNGDRIERGDKSDKGKRGDADGSRSGKPEKVSKPETRDKPEKSGKPDR